MEIKTDDNDDDDDDDDVDDISRPTKGVSFNGKVV